MGWQRRSKSEQAKKEKALRTSKKEKKKWSSSGPATTDKKKTTFMDRELYNKIIKDSENMKIITRSTISERYNIDLFLSTRILRELASAEKIELLRSSGNLVVYGGGKLNK